MTAGLISAVWAPQAPQLSGRDWERLLAQARASRLVARLAVQAQRGGWDVPPRVAAHLDAALRVASALRAHVVHELEQIERALAPLGVPVVALKGAAYVAAALPCADGRLFSDIDMLVPRAALREVEGALFAAGWIAAKLDPYDDRYYRDWMHELPPLRHVQRDSHLDVHHTLAPPTSRFVVDGQAVLDAAVALPPAPGRPAGVLHVLAPADMVLHSALHLMQEGEFGGGLRDLLDIRDLVVHFRARDAGFVAALAARARALGLDRVLGHVVAQIEALFGERLTDRGSPLTGAPRDLSGVLVQQMLAQVLPPIDARSEPARRRLSRELLYVRSHWLRMPWYQIGPHLARKAWKRAQKAAPAEKPA
jgi:hypothetical protein